MSRESSTSDFDSTIECPHCGHQFYHELHRCPNCRRNVYPDAGAAEEPVREIWGVDPNELESEPAWWPGSALAAAIAFGLFLSAAIGVVLYLIVGQFFDQRELLGWALSLTAAPLGSFAGGYLAAAYASRRPRRLGLAVGALSIGVVLLLDALHRELSLAALIRPISLVWWLPTIAAGWTGGALWSQLNISAVAGQLFSLPSEQDLYQELLAKVQHDQETAERLIEYERQFAPNANRLALIMSAISRWERDNR